MLGLCVYAHKKKQSLFFLSPWRTGGPEFIGCLLVNAIEQEIKRLDAINSKLSTFTLNQSGQLQPAAQGKIKFSQGS